MENQIPLLGLEGGLGSTSIAMRDGLFYLASGSRIARYTSYGDIIFMIYNGDRNPPPHNLKINVEENEVLTRWAFSWPLTSPGKLAVDSRRHILVEDHLPPERRVFDAGRGVLLDSIVLHFDGSGRFVEYLGQEGIGGSAFPRIDGLYTSVNDEIAVVCRLPDGWIVWWFSAGLIPLFSFPVRSDSIPVPPERPGVFPSVDRIAVAPDERQLLMKVDYYRAVVDESTGTRTGVEPDSSVIWVLGADTGIPLDTIEIPFYEQQAPGNRRETEKLFYTLLGAIRGGRIFLSLPVEGGYSILIVRSGIDGETGQSRGFIRVEPQELEYNTFSLSGDGILSGLLATESEARFVRWRTDRLVDGLQLQR
jgi:hypothetical protein